MEASQALEKVGTDKLAEVLSGMGEAEIASTTTAEEVNYRIIAEILAAETEAEMFAELPVWGSKDSVGKTFVVENVRGVFRSKVDNPNGNKGYLACSVVDTETGEAGILTTSAVRVAARIAWFQQHQAFPVTLEIYERTKTEEGFSILDARKVEA